MHPEAGWAADFAGVDHRGLVQSTLSGAIRQTRWCWRCPQGEGHSLQTPQREVTQALGTVEWSCAAHSSRLSFSRPSELRHPPT